MNLSTAVRIIKTDFQIDIELISVTIVFETPQKKEFYILIWRISGISSQS